MTDPVDPRAGEGAGGEKSGELFRWGAIWPAGLIILFLVLASYANSFRVPFVYDDLRTVVENDSIRDPANLRPLLFYNISRPFLNLTYALNYRLGELNPFGYHAFNVALHFANSLLLFLLVLFTLRGPGTARPREWFSALLPAAVFGVHPLFTEAVTYVSGRSSVLCGFFCLLTLGAFAVFRRAEGSRGRRIGYAASLGFFLLALGSKEEAAALPALIGLYDYFFGTGPERFSRGRLRAHLPFWLVVFFGALARLALFFRMEAGAEPGLFYATFISQFPAALAYLKLLAWPAGLRLVHDLPRQETIWSLPVLGAVGFCGLLLALAWRLRGRLPLFSFAAASYFILLSPYFVVPLPEVMTEHRAYLPGLLFCLLGGWAGARLAFSADWARRPFLALFGVLVVVLAVLTVQRNRVWGDEFRLWEDAAKKSPSSWRAHAGLGDIYLKQGRMNFAAYEYRKSLAIYPRNLDAWVNLGMTYVQRKMWEEAKDAFQTALYFDPGTVKALNNLGSLASLEGKREKAVRWFEEALKVDPENFSANLNLGDLFWKRDKERATRHYLVALKRAPLNYPREEIVARLEGRFPLPAWAE